MKLMSIKKDAQEIAASICEIAGVDVVIVDDEMERVADTFRYPYKRIDIHTRSIVGSIVSSGQPQVVENKNYFQNCVECASRDQCQMQGLIGVPILLRGTVVGAIGVVLERNNAKRLLENVSLILTFLDQMANLLASKLGSRPDFSDLQSMSSQWEDMLDTMDSGVVLVDEKNAVVVHNKRFSRYFQIPEGQCHGRPLTELVEHPLVAEALRKRVDVNDQSIVIPLAQTTFHGAFHVKQMWQDGLHRGAVFIFRDTDGLSSEGILLYSSHESETIRQICGETPLGDQLQHRLHDPVRRDEPLFFCGASEEYLLRLALAFHNSAGRTGRFVLINGRSLHDARIVKNPFLTGDDITGTLMLAHQGTLCVSDVFELPVYIQHWFLSCLRADSPLFQGTFQAQFIFLHSRPAQSGELLFRDPELMNLLESHRLDVPDPLETGRRLQALLDRNLAHYSACYGKQGMTVEPAAWELLLSFPWQQDLLTPYKVMEYLVRSCDGVITREAVAALQSRLGSSPSKSARDYEQQEIQRLLDAGIPCDQIANLMHISRATLYRRIKKYDLKPERK